MPFTHPTTRVSILGSGVRIVPFFLLVAVVLATPATVLAERSAKGDGTLSVNDGNGRVTLVWTRGIVFGRVDSGMIKIVTASGDEPAFEDFGTCAHPVVTDSSTSCKGSNVRFRFVPGKLDEIRISGKGIDITAVGQGRGTIAGRGSFDDGTYSLGGGAVLPLPLVETRFTLGQALPVGVGP
jgi:hypothetical protein